MPFGGIKSSGFGPHEQGRAAQNFLLAFGLSLVIDYDKQVLQMGPEIPDDPSEGQ